VDLFIFYDSECGMLAKKSASYATNYIKHFQLGI